MGEVYRAKDAKLKRDVAIKVLPESLARDADALARFEREALAVAALSNPNILSIFDFGTHDGVAYAVMELLEGETLRGKIAAGPLPPRRVLDYAAQIARGLAAAHEKGIVHRDLKPENVFVTKEGLVKILDFGLARQIALPADPGDTKSPTQVRLTETGVVLGTIAYMSPEQVRGLPADQRSDIFAFGCVLYEMLSGRRAFAGQSAVETMNAILKEEPAPLPPAATVTGAAGAAGAGLERVVTTCLAKEPAQRWQSAADLARELSWLGGSQERSAVGSAPASTRRSPVPRWLPWALAGVCAAGLVAALVLPRASSREQTVIRFSVRPAEPTRIDRKAASVTFAASPDGRSIAYLGASGGPAAVWLWSVADGTATRLSDTDGATSLFWSPDSLSVGFFAEGKLRRVAVSGGPSQVICETQFGQAGTWSANGVILFSEWLGTEQPGIYRVAAQGGLPKKIAIADGASDDIARAWPVFLPDGEHFLYIRGIVRGRTEDHRLCVGGLGPSEATCLLQADSRGEYAAPGRLLFVRKGALLAQPFDAAKRQVSGQPAALADRVAFVSPTGGADFSASADGRLLVYRHGNALSRLVWIDRFGREAGFVGEAGYFGLVRISPDARRLMVDAENAASGGHDVWMYDLATGIGSRLTSDPVSASWSIWSPDGGRVAFGSGRNGPPDIYLKEIGSQSPEEPLLERPGLQAPSDWSRDGRLLAYVDYSIARKTQRQIWLLPMMGEGKATPTPKLDPRRLDESPFSEYEPRFRPDSRFLAFVSEESGTPEVYVAAVDGTARKQRVSPAGGAFPRWSADGRELFFVSADSLMMVVSVENAGQELRFSQPKPLFQAPPFATFPLGSDFDVSGDGQRFLVNRGAEGQPELIAEHNWQQRLMK